LTQVNAVQKANDSFVALPDQTTSDRIGVCSWCQSLASTDVKTHDNRLSTGSMKSKQKTLIKKYENLSAAAKALIQFMAVYFKPINRTTVVKITGRLGVSDANGNPIDYKSFKPELDALMKSRLVGYEKGKKSGPIVVNDDLLDYVFQNVFFSDALPKFKDAIQVAIEKREIRIEPWKRDSDPGKIRDAFYEGDLATWQKLSSSVDEIPKILHPFRSEIFDRLQPASRMIFATKVTHDLAVGIETDLEQEDYKFASIEILLDLYIAQGNVEALKALHAKHPDCHEIIATIEFLEGDYDSSLAHFEVALKSLRKRTKKRTAVFAHLPTMLYAALLLRQNTTASQKELKRVIKQVNSWQNCYYAIAVAILPAIEKAAKPMMQIAQRACHERELPLFAVLQGWVWRWCFSDAEAPFSLKSIKRAGKVFRDSGTSFLAAECDAFSAMLSKGAEAKKLVKQSSAIHERCGTVSLVDFIKPEPKWSQALSAIEKLVGTADDSEQVQQTDQPLHDERMIWELYIDRDYVSVAPYVQKFSKKGWTKGRKVAISRIYNDRSQFEFLSEQDQAICSTLREETEHNHYGYREYYYEFDSLGLARALVGHPLIFNPNDRANPVEVTSSMPGLTIEKTKTQIRFDVTPVATGSPIVIKKESANRISIFEFTKKQRELAFLIAEMPPIPSDQHQRIADVTKSLSAVIAVQSDIEASVNEGNESETIKSNSNIVIQLTPWQEGLRAELFVRPLGEEGPLCRPGNGAASVFATVAGKPLATRRNLDDERKNLARLLSLSNQLDARTIGNKQTEWLFHDAEAALELVTELHSIPAKENVTVLWPRGKSHDVAALATDKQFKVSIKRCWIWLPKARRVL